MRPILALSRIGVFLLSGLVTMAVQTIVLFFTSGPAAYIYPLYYYRFLNRVFGVRVIVEGTPATGPDIVYVGNHISYLDIPALGATIIGSFVAKKEVAGWPFFGTMARMQRTFFISRNPKDAESETIALLKRLEEPVPLIIFPEGTSSDGTKILPFKSSFFQILLNQDIRIQPFTLSVLSVGGVSAIPGPTRDAYAWYGDMDLLPHLWAFAKGRGAVVKIRFHEPIAARSYADRKSLAAACHARVSEGLDLSLPSA